jgi:hypothetical protein
VEFPVRFWSRANEAWVQNTAPPGAALLTPGDGGAAQKRIKDALTRGILWITQGCSAIQLEQLVVDER